MASIPIIRKNTILIFLLFIAFFQPSFSMNNTAIQREDSLQVKVRIIDVFYVGWGAENKAVIEKVIRGDAEDFNDTIIFGITASRKFKFMNVGDTCLITLYNSGEKNEYTYLPAINGTVSGSNYIWLISRINKTSDLRWTYVGTAIISSDNSLFIWDFADSEAFYLDGMKSWDSRYLNKKITVEGILIQYIDGRSVIIDWKITDPK